MKLRISLLVISIASAACAGGERPKPEASPRPAVPDAPAPDVRPPADARLVLETGIRGPGAREPTAGPRDDSPVIKLRSPAIHPPQLQGGHGSLQFWHNGTFAPTSPAVLGTAHYDGAPVSDFMSTGPGMNPPALGGGWYRGIAFQGASYTATRADSIAGQLQDSQSGTAYLVLSAFHEEADPANPSRPIATVVHTIIKASDFALNTAIAFDGRDRLAIALRGHEDLPDPELAAIAASGSVTFTAGGIAVGQSLTADVQGDFADATITPSPSPNPNPNPVPTGTITPGLYQISYGALDQVECMGRLSGHEMDFARISLSSFGFVAGRIDIRRTSSTEVMIGGAAIASAYGRAPLPLENDGMIAPPGIYAAQVQKSGPGPQSTTAAAALLAIIGTASTPQSPQGLAGLVFVDPQDPNSFCQLGFDVVLTP